MTFSFTVSFIQNLSLSHNENYEYTSNKLFYTLQKEETIYDVGHKRILPVGVS
jgi:hypothetical protein